MDELRELSCVADIQDFLGNLPEDLKMAYDKIMDRVKNRKGASPKIAYRAFLWVMGCSRPLTDVELVAAVCQDPATEATNTVNITAKFIPGACNNLLTIDQSGVWRFSHLSVREYLETHHYRHAEAHTLIGTVCLRLLSDPTNKDRLDSIASEVEDTNGLLEYAVLHWTAHVRRHANPITDDCLQSLLKRFLGLPNEHSPAHVAWCSAYGALKSYTGPQLGERAIVSVLYFGLTGALDGWTSGLDVNWTTGDGCPLLHVAVQGKDGGNLEVARKLLELGHDVNAQGGLYGNALQAASERSGNGAMVRLLLDHGADVNAQGGEYGTALHAAATKFGNEATIGLLLDRGADINSQGVGDCTALQDAAAIGNEAIVRLLLDRKADVNARGAVYGSALQAASQPAKWQ